MSDIRRNPSVELAKEVARLAEQRPLPTRDTRVLSYVTRINEIFYFFNDINEFEILGFAQSDKRRSLVTGIVEEKYFSSKTPVTNDCRMLLSTV